MLGEIAIIIASCLCAQCNSYDLANVVYKKGRIPENSSINITLKNTGGEFSPPV